MYGTKLKLLIFLRNKLAILKTRRAAELISSQVKETSIWKNVASFIFKFVVLFIFGIFIIFPFYFMITYALAPKEQVIDSRVQIYYPRSLEWSNFSAAFQEGYVQALGWTILITLISVIGKIFFSITFGYAFSLKKWKYKKTSWLIFLSILLLPETALLIGQYRVVIILFWNEQPGTILALVAPFAASVFSGFMFRNAFEEISDRIKEAAMVDGCSNISFFFKVAIPLVSPTIWTVGILTAFAAWNGLLWPLLILEGNSNIKVINIWLLDVGRNPAEDEGQIPFLKNIRMAGAILAILPMFIIYFGFRKRILNAISKQGSTIKG